MAINKCVHDISLGEWCGTCEHEASTLDERVVDTRIIAYDDEQADQ